MAGPVSGVAGKLLEIKLAVGAADEFRAPGFEIVHHVNNVVDPDAGKLGIDQFAAVFEDVVKVKLRAVVLAHGGGEAAARHRGRTAGGAALGHLDDINTGLGAFKRGHGAGRAAADDQHIGFMTLDGNPEASAWCALSYLRISLCDLDECIDAGIGKGGVVDVQRELLDRRGLQVRFQRV